MGLVISHRVNDANTFNIQDNNLLKLGVMTILPSPSVIFNAILKKET